LEPSLPIEVDTEQEKPQPAIQPARRPIASRSARPMIALAAYLAKKSITPNQISILSVVFALIGAALVLFWNNPLPSSSAAGPKPSSSERLFIR
jgi:hypothetical protein